MPFYIPVRGALFWDELRRRLRGNRWYLALLAYNLLIGITFVALPAILPISKTRISSIQYGGLLLTLLFMAQRTIVLFIAPGLTAGAIAAERERGSLEQLSQTPISTGAVIFGKYLGAISQLLLVLLSGMPAFFLAYLYWHFPFKIQPLSTQLLNTVIYAAFYAAVGMLVSCWCSRARTAIITTYGIVLGLTALKLIYQLHMIWRFIPRMRAFAPVSIYNSISAYDPLGITLLLDPLFQFMFRTNIMNRTNYLLYQTLIIDGGTLLATCALLAWCVARLKRLRNPERVPRHTDPGDPIQAANFTGSLLSRKLARRAGKKR